MTVEKQYFKTPFSVAYWRQAFSELKDVRSLVFAALILALRIVIKPLKIPLAADVNITFGFIFNAVGSMVYGPVVGLLSGAVSDTLGYLIAPSGAYYFPFILLEMAGSFVFALFLYSTDLSPVRLMLAKFSVNLFVNVLLNAPIMTSYYQLYFTSVYQPFTWLRIVKNIVMLPFESLILIIVFRSVIPALKKAGYHVPGAVKLDFTRRHIVLLVALFVIGAASVAGYWIYDYNTKSFSASWSASERLERNTAMNQWVTEENSWLSPDETVTVIESARAKVFAREMTCELAIYRIDAERFREKQAEAEEAVRAGEEGANPYTLETLNGYSKSKAAKDDCLIRVADGVAVIDKNSGERISLSVTWEEGEEKQ